MKVKLHGYYRRSRRGGFITRPPVAAAVWTVSALFTLPKSALRKSHRPLDLGPDREGPDAFNPYAPD